MADTGADSMRDFTRTLYLVLAMTIVGTFSGAALAHEFQATAPEHNDDLGLPVTASSAQSGALESVVDQYKLWGANQTLNFCFFGGTQDVREFFVEASKVWDDLVSLTFDFGNAPAFRDCSPSTPSHIRVAFEYGSSWSLVGTDAIGAKQTDPTLNISISNFALTDKTTLAGTILHELGHAIAMKHEHQSPESHCDEEINWTLVYSELGQPPNNWSKATVDHNLKQFTKSRRLIVSAYDPKSIMHYSLPADWFLKGKQSSCWVSTNNDLSDQDRKAAKTSYPSVPQSQNAYIQDMEKGTEAALADLQLSKEDLEKIKADISSVLARIENRNVESNIDIGSIVTNGPCSAVVVGGSSNSTSCTITTNN